jgi:hypothetical protein
MIRIALLLTLLALSCPAAAGLVWHVPGDFGTISAALQATASGDTIRVGNGTFAPSTNGESFPLAIPDGIVLLGAGMQLSVLDAEDTGRVIQLVSTGAARVSGFTIRGGVADSGGGVQITAGTHEIDNLFVIDCGALLRGAALNVEGSAAPSVHHNILWECYDTDLVHSGDPHTSQWGGDASGSFRHNLVGRGDSNGLFVFENAAPEVRHNIFIDNGIVGTRGRGICFAGNDSTVIAHNMFWGNAIASLIMKDAQGVFTNVDAATANGVAPDDGVYGNIDADPLLVDPNAFDFSLSPSSPAIDAGEPGTGSDPDGTILDLGPIYHPMFPVHSPVAPRDGLAGLGRARPNPFNPRTVVELRLDRPGFAEVTIHDARGRRVRTLFAGTREAGRHSLGFDGLDDAGRALASGVYFARMSALGEFDTSAMVLVR